MPRRKRIVIEQEINDEIVDSLRNIDISNILKEREKKQHLLSSAVSSIVSQAKHLYEKEGVEEDSFVNMGLLPVQEAYEYLRDNGYNISFRAFGGRIERGVVPSVKLGRKRYIPVHVLNDILDLSREFYTVRGAYETYKKFVPDLKYRAFIGRVEKGAIPSVKIGTKRLIPKVVVDALVHVAKNYYSVSQAMEELRKAGIKIERNAFERRLDRRRIPHVKVGGRRFIPKSVLEELIVKEKQIMNRK